MHNKMPFNFLFMRKFLLYFVLLFSSLPLFADLGEDGYYRVQNAVTKRYAYLLDNKGAINVSTSSFDVQALELYLGAEKVCSDPSAIFYINKINSEGQKYEYDISGQGTSISGFLNRYMNVISGKNIDGQKTYYAYGKESGLAKYLGDRNSNLTDNRGLASLDVNGDRRLWYIIPVESNSSDNYFGVAPTLQYKDKYYYPMYAGFPYTAASEGIRFFTITRINAKGSEPSVGLKEITGIIPAGTPVIIECSHPIHSDNRLNIGATGVLADSNGNMLKGVYFNNDDVIHKNRTPYDRKSMRILTVKDGKLVFDVADIDYLPRNQAYLQLNEDSQFDIPCYQVLTEEEYDILNASVEGLEVSSVVDVYSLDGRLIKSGIAKTDVPSLGKGLYILKCGSKSEKLIVR